jgi:hypothetical protein
MDWLMTERTEAIRSAEKHIMAENFCVAAVFVSSRRCDLGALALDLNKNVHIICLAVLLRIQRARGCSQSLFLSKVQGLGLTQILAINKLGRDLIGRSSDTRDSAACQVRRHI